jgi:hypothetical protein
MKQYSIIAKVWKWPGVAAWHFIHLDKKLSADIKNIARTYCAGFVKVEAIVGKTSWTTALFPHTRTQVYLLSIKKSVRKKEDIFDGDTITVNFRLV